MKRLNKHALPYLVSLLALAPIANAADILKADKHFSAGEYNLAKESYLEAAKIGNPHAFYQLGNMYHKGLGFEKDPLNALLYISTAAALGLDKADTTLKKMLAPLSNVQKDSIEKILADNAQLNRLKVIKQTYYPIVKEDMLAYKVTFDGQDSLDSKFFAYDFNESFQENGWGQSQSELLADDTDDFYTPMSTPQQAFLIVDHDIGKDGSKRNFSDVQKVGLSQSLIQEYASFPTLKPSFQSQPIEFFHRVNMGAAAYNKFTLIEKNEKLYASVIRRYKQLQGGATIKDRYDLAMILQNFSWLPQEDGEVAERLLTLAKLGHPGAMYEYGYALLREQRDIQEAIKWLGLASSYGLARAEYRLAKLLTSSPWVEYDEQKALFWFESATKKDHVASALKVVEIKLIAEDDTLHDLSGAIQLLTKIANKQKMNPEYYYLLALSHINRENRDFTQVVSNLEKAISIGQRKNWDVADWQNLLTKLTQGRVFVTEEN